LLVSGCSYCPDRALEICFRAKLVPGPES
jgi:hypothetical protein